MEIFNVITSNAFSNICLLIGIPIFLSGFCIYLVAENSKGKNYDKSEKMSGIGIIMSISGVFVMFCVPLVMFLLVFVAVCAPFYIIAKIVQYFIFRR